MAFCNKCGTQLNEGVTACPNCGTVVAQPQQPVEQNTVVNTFQNLNNTVDSTSQFQADDIKNNKAMAILAYIGILWLIPFFGAKESPYAQYHCKQGFNLLLLDVAYAVVSTLLSLIFRETVFFVSVVPTWVLALISLLGIPIVVLLVLGICNAASGKAKELPIIGQYKFLK